MTNQLTFCYISETLVRNGLKHKWYIIVIDSTNTSSCIFNKMQTVRKVSYTSLEYMFIHAEAAISENHEHKSFFYVNVYYFKHPVMEFIIS